MPAETASSYVGMGGTSTRSSSRFEAMADGGSSASWASSSRVVYVQVGNVIGSGGIKCMGKVEWENRNERQTETGLAKGASIEWK